MPMHMVHRFVDEYPEMRELFENGLFSEESLRILGDPIGDWPLFLKTPLEEDIRIFQIHHSYRSDMAVDLEENRAPYQFRHEKGIFDGIIVERSYVHKEGMRSIETIFQDATTHVRYFPVSLIGFVKDNCDWLDEATFKRYTALSPFYYVDSHVTWEQVKAFKAAV